MKMVTVMGALAMCVALAGGAGGTAHADPIRAAGLPQTGDQMSYVQRGDSVAVYRFGERLADVEVRSAAHPGGRAKLVLRVKAHKTFAFRAGQFLWADAEGDHDASDPVRKFRVKGGDTETVSIRFAGVRNGNVVWAPRRENSVGVWQVEGSAAKGLGHLLSPSYVQKDARVSVYRSGRVVGRVKAQSAVHEKGWGTVRLDIEAVKKFSVRPAAFGWTDRAGVRHVPVGAKKITLKPGARQTVHLRYSEVGAGQLAWSPRRGLTAGAWGVG
ncbi:hypothetical protein [Kineosporia succinea]|uniref:Uncharacterized protein n=1 Tax=Kineosporia succinea TaxID=84632 RepID=A0ABT9P2L4_9ACTN|nr:hypothetical protein [Kineosporia succinea]MDP9826929.1 hypothetical protein [Kineosporia succinea]